MRQANQAVVRSSTRISGRLRGECGSDVFEAAIVLPVLLTIFLALYSFGRGWDIYQTMTRAAREGARQAVTTSCAVCGNNLYASSDVQSDFVYPALQADGLDTTKVQNYTQGYTWLDNTSPNEVCGLYISFSYPYTLNVPFTPVPLTNITLTTRVQMRLENQPISGTCP
ncbi:MAG TPA: TadE family protein [Candidatus Acidoferrales bacterium]|nr:TadE family protein [Candidatus Acidoferrales bacterium]